MDDMKSYPESHPTSYPKEVDPQAGGEGVSGYRSLAELRRDGITVEKSTYGDLPLAAVESPHGPETDQFSLRDLFSSKEVDGKQRYSLTSLGRQLARETEQIMAGRSEWASADAQARREHLTKIINQQQQETGEQLTEAEQRKLIELLNRSIGAQRHYREQLTDIKSEFKAMIPQFEADELTALGLPGKPEDVDQLEIGPIKAAQLLEKAETVWYGADAFLETEKAHDQIVALAEERSRALKVENQELEEKVKPFIDVRKMWAGFRQQTLGQKAATVAVTAGLACMIGMTAAGLVGSVVEKPYLHQADLSPQPQPEHGREPTHLAHVSPTIAKDILHQTLSHPQAEISFHGQAGTVDTQADVLDYQQVHAAKALPVLGHHQVFIMELPHTPQTPDGGLYITAHNNGTTIDNPHEFSVQIAQDGKPLVDHIDVGPLQGKFDALTTMDRQDDIGQAISHLPRAEAGKLYLYHQACGDLPGVWNKVPGLAKLFGISNKDVPRYLVRFEVTGVDPDLARQMGMPLEMGQVIKEPSSA